MVLSLPAYAMGSLLKLFIYWRTYAEEEKWHY